MVDTRRKRESRSPLSRSEDRRRMIAEEAYLKAERRDFRGGNPDDDWLEAEAEIEARLEKRDSR